MSSDVLDRREFLAASGTGLAGLALAAEARAGRAESSKTVRCGFVGVGSRGTALLEAVLQLEGVEVAAICDIDPAHLNRARDRVEKERGTRPAGFEDWNQLLARDDIPAVVAALPCDLHYPMYRDALAAGKHLYGEKPLCLTVADADALVKQAGAAGKVFQVGFQRRFHARLRQAVQLVRQGVVGRPYDGRGVRFGSGDPYRRPGEWFSFRERSGDWMLEQAVHNFDVFTWALGELPASAFGTGRQDLFKDWDPKRNVSDYYTAVLRYRNGLTLTWTHTWAAPPQPQFAYSHEQLVGPKGAIDLNKGLIAFRKGAEPAGRPTQQVAGDSPRDTTGLALRSFFECVRTGKPAQVGVKEGRDATLVGLLVRAAVYGQRVVTMEEVLQG